MLLTAGCQTLQPAVRTETDPGEQFWDNFEKFLLTHQSEKTVYDRMSFGRRYGHILLGDGNAQELLQLPRDKRLHAMKALASLSKFLGKYDQWQQIRRQFQLRWEKEDSLAFFERVYDSEEDLDAMLKWLRQTLQTVPAGSARVLKFNVMTGMRAAECFKSIAIINSKKMDDPRVAYYNRERQTLEHFRYPEQFLRRTKKLFISIVDDRILDIARTADADLTYQKLRIWLHNRGNSMNMQYCRSIYSTFLRLRGIESETLDILQGRAPASVFARHYFKPSGSDMANRVLDGLEELEKELAIN